MPKRRCEALPEFLFGTLIIWLEPRIGKVFVQLLMAEGGRLAQQLQCGVDRYPVYPGFESRGTFELVPFVPGTEQCILHRIGSKVLVPRNAQARRKPVITSIGDRPLKLGLRG
jgi:hypothetical protein